MKHTIYYNREGRPVVYTDDGVHLFFFNGPAAGYFHGTSVYSFRGVHLGVSDHGWIRDNNGRPVLFEKDAAGGPLRPNLKVIPTKSIKHVMPVKKDRSVKPSNPVKATTWSSLSGESFFSQEKTDYNTMHVAG